MTMAAHKVVCIGVGNPFRRDDAVGRAVVEQLRGQIPRWVTLLLEIGDAAELLNAWNGADYAILVDAMQSGAPGTIHRLDAKKEKVARFSHSSTHAFGIVEAIELARALGELPAELIIYGIEALEFSAGTGLSPEVAEAVPRAANLILQGIQHYCRAASFTTHSDDGSYNQSLNVGSVLSHARNL